MPSELTIIALVGGALAFIFACSRPTGDAFQPSRLAAFFSNIRLAVPRLLALRNRSDRKSFLYGLVAGVVFAVFCNLVPLFYTYRAYGTDGVEVIGFPLVFRSAGGFVFTTHFYWLAFLADTVFAAVVALVAGYAGIGIQALLARRPHRDKNERDEMA